MRLKVNFDGLLQAVHMMTHVESVFHPNIDIGEKTIIMDEPRLDEVILDAQGVFLTWQNVPILLYIPDHSYGQNFYLAQENPRRGNKVHFSECKTLVEMRRSGSYHKRYAVTNNTSGQFGIYSTKHYDIASEPDAFAALYPCRFCLQHTNYAQFNELSKAEQNKLIQHFDFEQLFNDYHAAFSTLPDKRASSTRDTF